MLAQLGNSCLFLFCFSWSPGSGSKDSQCNIEGVDTMLSHSSSGLSLHVPFVYCSSLIAGELLGRGQLAAGKTNKRTSKTKV